MPPNTEMREMVLNHVSLRSPDHHTALCWLKDVAIGMAQLLPIAQPSLRTHLPIHEIRIAPDLSLFDAYIALKKTGAREESVFLMRLSAKYPLESEIEAEVRDRFLACEGHEIPSDDWKPLVLCVITNWIAIGLPSVPNWDKDQLTIDFDELLPDGSIEETSETIDNLARSEHASSKCERHRARFLDQDSFAVWEKKHEVFSNLIFGPDVKPPPEFLGSTVRRLAELDKSAAEWRNIGGPVPPWTCKVTPESQSVRNNPTLLNERRFRSRHGTRDLFEWHARIGSKFRIHLRFDTGSREIEIGYIGPHLPL